MAHPGWPVRQQWVATPPPGAVRPRPPGRKAPYLGPPSYPATPRWGFPTLAWRWPSSVPGTPSAMPSPVDRVRFLARHTTAMLWLVAVLGVLAAAGETWRYVLLLQSRNGALSAGVVTFADALATAGSVLTIAAGVLAAVTTIWWLFVARAAAVESSGYERSRRDWHVLVGLLVPGLNLAVAGSVLAELEHAVLRRPASSRPRPTGLVLLWWITWAANGVMFAVTLLWRLRDSVQAKADGVVLAALTDLLAASVAALTAMVVWRLTVLLVPVDLGSVRMMRVVRVNDAPEPPLRVSRPAGVRR